MPYLKKLLLLCVAFSSPLLAQIIDLEETPTPCVIQSKQIILPNFPYAFNPSLIKWEGSFLLCFRAGKEYRYDDEIPIHSEDFFDYDYVDKYSPNRIGLVWLDENLNPCSTPQILNIPNYNSTYRQQDPRLVVVGNRIFIVYSDIVKGMYIDYTRRMCTAELFIENDSFYVRDTACLTAFDGAKETLWEKNWVPFDYEDNLMLAYSLTPHKILYPLLNSGVCSTIAVTNKKANWGWGVLRGGTPAVLINDQEYLSFFHSSCVLESVQSGGKKMQHYFMGAYTFAAQPPFELKRISPAPVIGKNFYNGPKYKTWKPLIVVFPGGVVEEKDHFLVAYGRQDHEIWITKIDKTGLLDSLICVQ